MDAQQQRRWKQVKVRQVADPQTLGGNYDLRMIKLTSDHLTQADKSMNTKLWNFFPLVPFCPLETLILAHFRTMEGPPFDFPSYAKEATCEEWRHLLNKGSALSLESWWPFLTANPTVAFSTLQRRAAGHVEPLSVVVSNVTKKKQEVNKLFKNKDYRGALQGYVECLSEMMPWSASPLILTADQCYDSGLAQLEATLWNNIFITALKSTNFCIHIKEELLVTSYEAVINMRYVPASALYKCLRRFAKLLNEEESPLSIQRAWYEADLMEDAAEAMVHKDSDAWAHKDCISEHVCLSKPFRVLMKVWELS